MTFSGNHPYIICAEVLASAPQQLKASRSFLTFMLRLLRRPRLCSSITAPSYLPLFRTSPAATMSSAVGVKRKSDVGASGPDAKKPKANASITSFFGQPKPVSNTSATAPNNPPPAVKFNKDKWVESLSVDEKDLLKLEIETLHESWLAHLKDEIRSESFLNLKRFLKSESEANQKVYPPPEDIYSW